MKKSSWPLLFVAAGLGAFSFGPSPRPSFERAPVNPAFITYLQQRSTGGVYRGEIPGPQVMSSAPVVLRPRDRAFPGYFCVEDPVTNGAYSVRNRGDCASDWAFAAMGSLESFLHVSSGHKYSPELRPDFSEQNMIDHAGFTSGPCDGGILPMALAYLTRWAGPIREWDDPYVVGLGVSDGAVSPVQKHVQAVRFIPPRASATDNDLLKSAVYDLGVAYVSMYWVDGGFNPVSNGYYNNGVETGGREHAVNVVGWNDGFNAFNAAPPGPGAFIVKDSRGTSWGDHGYFYVSYYDTKFARSLFNGTITGESTLDYKGLFQYDPLGWVSSWGLDAAETCWGANVFKAPVATKISAVGLYALAAGTQVQIYVYTAVQAGKPRTGTLKASCVKTMTYPGYYTVRLPAVVGVAGGQKFSIVVKFTTPGWNAPVPTEERLAGYSDAAISHAGESFISADGAIGAAWTDFYSYPKAAGAYPNVCLKAFVEPKPAIEVTNPQAGQRYNRGSYTTITWNKYGKMSGWVKIQLFRGTTKVRDLTTETGNSGSFSALFDNALPLGNTYWVKVMTKDGLVKGVSGKFILASW